jgi:hypothetical protein
MQGKAGKVRACLLATDPDDKPHRNEFRKKDRDERAAELRLPLEKIKIH